MRYLMHPQNMDICLLERIVNGQATYEWWNLGYVGKPYFVQFAAKPRNISDWQDITLVAHKKRTEPGLPK